MGVAVRSLLKFICKFLWIESDCGHLYFRSLFRESVVVVDLGANKGDFCAEVLKKNNLAQAILVEANPSLVETLKRRYLKNKSVSVENYCASGVSGNEVSFFISKNLEASSVNKNFSEKFDLASEVRVKTISLKEIILKFQLRHIDLLKIDIEGAEYDLLENFDKEEYGKVAQISIEFHDFMDPNLRLKSEECIRRLKQFGYMFIHVGSNYGYGSPYANCLFFKLNVANFMKIAFYPFRLTAEALKLR